jgi:DNA-3-methyladenine glycosylase I
MYSWIGQQAAGFRLFPPSNAILNAEPGRKFNLAHFGLPGERPPAFFDGMSAVRCAWARSALSIPYHDAEWGVPVHDDRRLFEFLILEGAQAGLSWETILAKRLRYREVYQGFDPRRVAGFGERETAALLADPGIVRNRLKVAASIENARRFLEVQAEFGTFDAYVWRFVDGAPIQNLPASSAEIPATSERSQRLSDDLRKRGFRFVGSTIVYAFMQATGMVNDHVAECFRAREIGPDAGA